MQAAANRCRLATCKSHNVAAAAAPRPRIARGSGSGTARRSSSAAVAAAAPGAATAGTVDALLAAAAGTERGTKTSPETRAEIARCVAALKAAGAGSRTGVLVFAARRVAGGGGGGSGGAASLCRPRPLVNLSANPRAPVNDPTHRSQNTTLHNPQPTPTTHTTTVDAASGTWELVWTTEKETLFIVQNAKWLGTRAGGVYQVVDLEKGRLQNVITFPPEGAFIVDSAIAAEGAQRVNFQFDAAKLKLPGGRELKVPPVGKGWFDTVYVDDRVRVAEDSRGDTLVVRRDGPPRVFA